MTLKTLYSFINDIIYCSDSSIFGNSNFVVRLIVEIFQFNIVAFFLVSLAIAAWICRSLSIISSILIF